MSVLRARLEKGDESLRAELVDRLARDAAAGDNQAGADLAWAILRFGLARPALRRYLIGDSERNSLAPRIVRSLSPPVRMPKVL